MDPYEVLGCTPATPLDEIETAYRLLLRRHHPDLHQDGGADAVDVAERTTRQLTAAMAEIREHHGTAPRARASSYPPPDAGRRGGGFGGYDYHGPDPWQTRRRQPEDGARPDADWFGQEPTEHDDDEPVPCPYCGEGFFELDDFRRHLAASHQRTAVTSSSRSDRPQPKVFQLLGKLRYVPPLLVVLFIGLALIANMPVWIWLSLMVFLLLVLWAQTSKRFRPRSGLEI